MVDPTDGRTKPNPELVKDHLFHEGRLTEAQTLFILNSATELMRREPNMVTVNSPVTGTLVSILISVDPCVLISTLLQSVEISTVSL